MISCDVIRDLLPLYADDLLSQCSRELVEAHIDACPECKEMLDAMLRPLDPEPAEEDFRDALRKNRRKQRRRIILVCALTVLACVLGWWIYMETHFYGETPHVVTTDETKILAEVPQLALTDDEITLAESLLREPTFRDAIAQSSVSVDVPAEKVEHLLTDIMPDNTTDVYACVLSNRNICLDFLGEHHRITLEYIDPDQNGTVDLIRKTVALVEKGEDVRVVYVVEYIPVLERHAYEKLQLKHIWFSFLSDYFRE